jgi:hypothetical protein
MLIGYAKVLGEEKTTKKPVHFIEEPDLVGQEAYMPLYISNRKESHV